MLTLLLVVPALTALGAIVLHRQHFKAIAAGFLAGTLVTFLVFLAVAALTVLPQFLGAAWSIKLVALCVLLIGFMSAGPGGTIGILIACVIHTQSRRARPQLLGCSTHLPPNADPVAVQIKPAPWWICMLISFLALLGWSAAYRYFVGPLDYSDMGQYRFRKLLRHMSPHDNSDPKFYVTKDAT